MFFFPRDQDDKLGISSEYVSLGRCWEHLEMKQKKYAYILHKIY